MITWLATLGLRVKVYLAVAAIGLLTLGFFYVQWKLASSKAKSEEIRRKSLEAAHKTELNISEKISKLRVKEQKWRNEILSRKTRDHFDQGWGP